MVYYYVGKADLGKDYWNPNRKLGVNHSFSGVIKPLYGKKVAIHGTLFCIFKLFRIIVA